MSGTVGQQSSSQVFGVTEVFRTSTVEPKKSGVVREYVKDMSQQVF